MAMFMPNSFNFTILFVASMLLIIIFSVSSSSRYSGFSWVSSRTCFIKLTKLSCLNSCVVIFTAILTDGKPASCQALFCLQAVLSTHSLNAETSPVSSAKGMKSMGSNKPFVGCIQRINASTDANRLSLKSY